MEEKSPSYTIWSQICSLGVEILQNNRHRSSLEWQRLLFTSVLINDASLIGSGSRWVPTPSLLDSFSLQQALANACKFSLIQTLVPGRNVVALYKHSLLGKTSWQRGGASRDKRSQNGRRMLKWFFPSFCWQCTPQPGVIWAFGFRTVTVESLVQSLPDRNLSERRIGDRTNDKLIPSTVTVSAQGQICAAKSHWAAYLAN